MWPATGGVGRTGKTGPDAMSGGALPGTRRPRSDGKDSAARLTPPEGTDQRQRSQLSIRYTTEREVMISL
ncbi:hypothetical protein GCM10027605_08020 [Micromonospora zhanjiangensis]